MPEGPAIYLDYAATTPVAPEVAAAMLECLGADANFANPSSTHSPGRCAAAAVERARAQVAALIGARAGEIVWTSGATESDNLAILGAARYLRDRGRHLVTSRIEHKAVIDSFRALEREGWEVTWLEPEPSGVHPPEQVAAALREDTTLVSIMLVNNEIGVLQDVAAIGERCRERGVLLHVDAAQGVGKLPVDVTALNADLLSLTAHKLYGPKGIGALYVAARPGVQLSPLLHGGGQERGLRPGTLPVHQIAGLGAAAALAAEALETGEPARIAALRRRAWDGLAAAGGVTLNGDPERRVAGILNVSVEGVEGESLRYAMQPVALASGSACNSASAEPSYVLRALGRGDRLAESSLRLSFGRWTTEEEVDAAVARFQAAVAHLRALSPAAA